VYGPFNLQPDSLSSNSLFGISVGMGASLVACGAPQAYNGDGVVFLFDSTLFFIIPFFICHILSSFLPNPAVNTQQQVFKFFNLSEQMASQYAH
jgi:hypothetical protein